MNEDFYISLIYKELDQNISEKEGAELKNWRAESIENEKQYQAILLAWNSADQLKVEPKNLDADAAFDELMAKVDKHTLVSVSTPKKIPVDQYNIPKRRNDWVRIAAGIALIIGVGMMAYHFIFSAPQVEMVEVQTQEHDSIVDLPDGSKITLAAHSHLSYPENFSEDSRKVYLKKGIAYFEIEPNPKRAFIVETAQEQVEVLGTKFIVDISGKLHKVWVTEGKVSYRISDTQKAITLTKGQTGVVNLSQNTIEQRATN